MVKVLRDLGGDLDEYALTAADVTDFVEAAQDAVGAALTDTATIDLIYDDAGNTIKGDVKTDSIDNTFLKNVAQYTLKGRVSAGTGDPEDLTASQAKTLLAIVPGDVAGFDTQVRTSRLDQMATPTAPVSAGSQKITSLADGTVSTDAVNLGQLTAAIEARKIKDPVAVATTGNITLSGEQTLDGYLTSSSRVLVKNQSTQANNGIYVTSAGAWTRAADANTAAEISNASVLVQNGTVGKGDIFTSNAITTLGTDAITWAQTGEGNTVYTADGSTIQLVGTQFSIPNSGVGTSQVANDAITYAKLQNVSATSRLLGRITAGAGDAEELTAANVKTILGYAASEVAFTPAGDIAATNVQAAIAELLSEAFPLGWGAWTTWTPTITQSGSVSRTINSARYTRLGKLVFFNCDMSVTGPGIAAQSVIVGGLPVTSQTPISGMVGNFELFDASAGQDFSAMCRLASSTSMSGLDTRANGVLGASGTFTAALASGDVIRLNGFYEGV